jgi:predicted AAA+ superfamily ATPase
MPIRPRLAGRRLTALARRFPALAILGARQVGKSTLARHIFPEFAYVDLENPIDFARAHSDVALLLAQHRRLVLDEAQRLPALFPALRSALDADPRRRVALLGSASPSLMRHISESLTGRVGIFELGGISVFEQDAPALWVRGGFPRVHWSRPRSRPEEWYPSYLRTTLEQDIPQLGVRVAASRMRTLITMLAHSQGNVCNLSELGGSLGVSYHSVAYILDVFEGVFLVRRLQPYAANLRKRLVKSPKVYVRDTGLLHALLGIPFAKASLLAHPKAGASFESFCIEQILLHARLFDPSAEGFFFRTHTGQEVDLLLRTGSDLIPIEIKLGLTPPDTRSLEVCMRDLGLSRGYVVNLSTSPIEIRRGVWMCGLVDLLKRLGLAPRAVRERPRGRQAKSSRPSR